MTVHVHFGWFNHRTMGVSLSSEMIESCMCERRSLYDFTLVQLFGDLEFLFFEQLNLTASLYLLTLLKSLFHLTAKLSTIYSINTGINRRRKPYIFEKSLKGIPEYSRLKWCVQIFQCILRLSIFVPTSLGRRGHPHCGTRLL